MIVVVRTQTSQMNKTRFAWSEMRGQRDESICIIPAYQVSQTKGTTAGPNTAYSQQIDHMIVEGDTIFDPLTRILQDLRDLITQKYTEGFRPILIMDANDNWLQTSSKVFRVFVKEMHIVDPYHDKFKISGLTGTTYAQAS